MNFPSLPVPDELLTDERSWRYQSDSPIGGTARLRVWACTGDVCLAVVTETGQGLAITNGIEHIRAALVPQYGRDLVLIEHWPAEHDGERIEHLDQVAFTAGGLPSWRQIWPTPTTNPDHELFQKWMSDHGRQLLNTHRP